MLSLEQYAHNVVKACLVLSVKNVMQAASSSSEFASVKLIFRNFLKTL